MLISYHIISFDPGASSSESPQCAFEGVGCGVWKGRRGSCSECVFRCHLRHTFIRFISDTTLGSVVVAVATWLAVTS